MTTAHEHAAHLAILKLLADKLSDAKTTAAGQVRDSWYPGDRNTAVLPDGTPIGTVTLAKGRTSARLADEDAYTTWVTKTHPDQIETITTTRVRADFTDRILSAARQRGEPVDAETGEIVPGITITEGDPYPTVRLDDQAHHNTATAWRDGTLHALLAGLIAIEGTDDATP